MVNLLEGNCRDTEICKENIEKKNVIMQLCILQLCASLPSKQTMLFFKCELLCYHANFILVSITMWSPSASLQSIYTIVKWSNELNFTCRNVHQCLC